MTIAERESDAFMAYNYFRGRPSTEWGRCIYGRVYCPLHGRHSANLMTGGCPFSRWTLPVKIVKLIKSLKFGFSYGQSVNL